VLVEAGHRCAIPTCKHPTTEIAHIVPWAQCQSHEFDNLIALCPNCHTRFDTTKDIDRKSMQIYKYNLGLLNGRYSDFERRVLDQLVLTRKEAVRLPAGYGPLLDYLVRDGILGIPTMDTRSGGAVTGDGELLMGFEVYRLTEHGRTVVANYAAARSIDERSASVRSGEHRPRSVFPAFSYYTPPPSTM